MRLFSVLSKVALGSLILGLLVPISSSALVTSSTVAFDADDSITLAGSVSDTATATLTQTFATTTGRVDSATIYVAITSANASYATLRIKVSDSSTNITTVSGNRKTSPNICFTGLKCQESLTVFDTTTVQAQDGTSHLRTTTDFPSQAGTDTATSNNAGRNYAIDPDGNSYSLLSNNDSRTISLETVQRNNSASSYVATVKYSVGLHAIQQAGTYTVVASVINYTGGSGAATSVSATATWTVTVTAPSNAATAASKVIMAQGAVTPGLSDSTVVASRTAAAAGATGQAATIFIEQVNSSGTALNGTRYSPSVATNRTGESVTVTVTGEAWITQASGTTGSAPAASANQKTLTLSSANYVHVWPTGTAGTATVSFTTGSGLSLGSKSLTFYGTRSAIAVDQTNFTIGRAGNGANGFTSGVTTPTDYYPAAGSTAAGTAVTGLPAFVIKVTDSGGRGVPTTVTGLSSNTNVVASVSCLADDALSDYSTGGVGYHNCNFTTAASAASGQSATITFRMVDPAVTNSTAYISATPVTVTIGGSISTETISFNDGADGYVPGARMTVTRTAKDSSGNPVFDGAGVVAITISGSTAGSSTDTSQGGRYIGGTSVTGDKASENLYAPTNPGTYTATGTGGAGGLQTITGSFKVQDNTAATAAATAATDAALEAIDAANAATDAANLAAEAADAATVAAEEARDAADAATAAVEALATEVATLMAALKAQITTLANTVAKIAKKVKA